MPFTFTFSVPSFVSQTDEARRAKGWRDFEKIMREGVWWFGPAEVKGLLKKITTRPKPGRPAETWINGRLLEEYDAAVREVAPKRLNKAVAILAVIIPRQAKSSVVPRQSAGAWIVY